MEYLFNLIKKKPKESIYLVYDFSGSNKKFLTKLDFDCVEIFVTNNQITRVPIFITKYDGVISEISNNQLTFNYYANVSSESLDNPIQELFLYPNEIKQLDFKRIDNIKKNIVFEKLKLWNIDFFIKLE